MLLIFIDYLLYRYTTVLNRTHKIIETLSSGHKCPSYLSIEKDADSTFKV